MRVLLFSALPGLDSVSGDTSYTETLLANPPTGVDYIDYAAAIEAGIVRSRGRRATLRHWRPVDLLIFAARAIELVGRRAGLMFREPTWFITIDATRIDLVHQHLFAIRQVGCRVPVVSSAGLPLEELYEARERWPKWRTTIATLLERLYSRAADVHVPWLRPARGGVLTVYSAHFAAVLRQRYRVRGPVLLASTGLGEEGGVEARNAQPGVVAFIGRDFIRKGGDLALAAVSQARRVRPDLRLIVATSGEYRHLVPKDGSVTAYFDASRDTVLTQILPEADVLLAPTRLDCGAPYGVLEALRAGVGVVLTSCAWLDDRLAEPGVHRVQPTVDALAEALLRTLALPADERRASAKALWREHFSPEALHAQLLPAYQRALGELDEGPPRRSHLEDSYGVRRGCVQIFRR